METMQISIGEWENKLWYIQQNTLKSYIIDIPGNVTKS